MVGWSAADWKQFGAAKLGAVGRPHARDPGAHRGRDETASSRCVRAVDAAGDAAMRLGVTDDGWLRTGDLARIDDDGFVWIDGRVSAMVNRGGLKVFPDEVEEHLRGYPGVADAAVAGVARRPTGRGAVGVRRRRRRMRRSTPTRWLEWCRETLAPYKIPIGVTLVDELPRNEAGKVLREKLVARLT